MGFYEDVAQYYAELSNKLPAALDREGCESALRAGEPESAVAELLELACEDGILTDDILNEAELRVGSVKMEEFIDALRQYMKRDSVA